MTCHEATTLMEGKDREVHLRDDHGALALHLTSCRRCRDASKVARLSSAVFDALREESVPGPTFYSHLRVRLAEVEPSRPDIGLLHALGFARRLIPALAVGVLLLAGVTLSVGGSRSSLPVQVRSGTEVYAFSLEEVNLPGVVGQPSLDQMLAFVLAERTGPAPDTDPGCEAQEAQCDDARVKSGR